MEKDLSFNKEHAIIAQNSATAAANIVAAQIQAGVGSLDPMAAFDTYRAHIFNGTLTLGGAEMIVETFESPTSVAQAVATPPTRFPDSFPEPEAAQPSYGGGGNGGSGGGNGAGSVVLKFGKHRGKTIAQVSQEDAGWLTWASENTNNDFVKNKIREFLSA
jgi:hypothetical protein